MDGCGLFLRLELSNGDRRNARRAELLCHSSPVQRQTSALPQPASRRQPEPFLCAPYVADENGKFRPTEKITQCPWAKGSEPCRMRKHDFRGRKTGPCIPIRILRCKSHGQYFTVYPMGHVPYDRQPIVAVGLGGNPLDERKKEGVARWRDSGFCGGGGCFRTTALASGRDGRKGSAWWLRLSTSLD